MFLSVYVTLVTVYSFQAFQRKKQLFSLNINGYNLVIGLDKDRHGHDYVIEGYARLKQGCTRI